MTNDDVLFPDGPEEAARQVAREITGPTIEIIEKEREFLTRLGHALVETTMTNQAQHERRCPDCGADASGGHPTCGVCGYQFELTRGRLPTRPGNSSPEIDPPPSTEDPLGHITRGKPCPECNADPKNVFGEEGSRKCGVCGYSEADTPPPGSHFAFGP